MLFYEPLFLFGFFPLLFTGYVLLRHVARGAMAWIAVASALFYLWAEPKFFLIVLASAALDYWLGKRIAAPSSSRWHLRAGVISNLSLLLAFKYAVFFIGEIANPLAALLGGGGFRVPQLILPIGISFLVFEKITYLVDISRRISVPAESFPKYLFFVFFFPKLLAGPIIKYHEIEPQITRPQPWGLVVVAAGFERFAVGICKKVLIADPASVISDQVFSAPMAQLSATDSWIGALMFTVQIYFDFSAYSDMAIGLALMLGFKLRENFNFPYRSIGITEFWRRWHISLSTWIREYLYIPLGGSRVSTARTYANLLVAFLASGLWHGANWTYIAWGAFHGVFLIAERAFLARWLRAMPALIGTVITFLVLVHGWVLFRSPDIAHAARYYERMYDWLTLGQTVYVPLPTAVISMAALIASMTPWRNARIAALAETPLIRLMLRAVLAALFLYSLGKVLTQPFQPFLYFRF